MKRVLCMLLTLIMAVSVAAPIMTAMPLEAAAQETGEWVGAWGTGITEIGFKDYPNLIIPAGACTARMVITPTISGNKIRLKLSNKYGTTSMKINRIRIAKSLGNDVIDTKTTVKVTVNGKGTDFIIPAGQEIHTDPIPFNVVANEPIAVSAYLDEFQNITSVGLSGGKTYLTPSISPGDQKTTAKDFGFVCIPLAIGELISVVPLIADADVYTEAEDPYSVVIIGDSTVSNEVPAYLSRLIAAEACNNVGIVGKGIIGNTLLTTNDGLLDRIYGDSVLERMTEDVLQQTNVRYAVIKIGGNDIIHPKSKGIAEQTAPPQPTAQEIIRGFQQFILRCHDVGIKVVACSITQWKGTTRNYFGDSEDGPEYEWDEADWQIALDVNEWLATTDMLDGFVDLNEVTANPKDPAKFRDDLTSDYIHPNDTAQQLWAREFPLSLIGVEKSPSRIVLDDSSIKLNKGKTKTLKYTIYPLTAKEADISWSSSNTAVASVDKNGKVTAKGNGTATITCETYNGRKDTCKVTVTTLASKITLSATETRMYTTQTKTLKASVYPSGTSNKAVKWSSANSAVAKVSSKGKITAVSPGTTVITCATEDGGAVSTCKVTVTKKIPVKSISLNRDSKTVYKGSSYQLVATIKPSDASNKKVTWKSTNTSVATVSSSGKVTAKKNGTADILATATDGKLIAACTITVKTKVTGVTLNKSSVDAYIGRKTTLTATVKPSSASNKGVTWKSSNKKIATVNSKGVITGKKAGTVTITVTTKDGKYTDTCKVTVSKYIKTKDVELNASRKTLNVRDTYSLKATVSPSNASEKGVTWKSSDTSVAKVSSKGKVTAVGKGTATITCTTKDGKHKDTFKVTVKTVKVKSVKLSETSLRLASGDSDTIKATIKPSNATNKNVTWKSSNSEIAKVNSKGKVTGVSKGTVTITCTTKDGKYKAKCKVTVYGVEKDPDQKVFDVKLNKSAYTMKVGKTYTLLATIVPQNAANQNVTWKSSNTSVATVSSKGKVTAKKAGTAIITVTTKDGKYTDTCKITVK